MKTIKSLFIALALIMGVGMAHAEEGTQGIGIGFTYGVGARDMSNLGLALRYNYQLSDNVRLQPNFIYYFDTDKFKEKDLGFDLHYLFNMDNDKFHMFPIFGVTTIFGQECEYGEKGMDDYHAKDNFVHFGCNFGGGMQYDVTDDFALTLEARYKLVNTHDNFNISIGCAMTF